MMLALALGASAAQARPRTVTLVAVGDVMLARGVAEQVQRHGWKYPFAHVAGPLRAADLVFGNLECGIGERGRPVPKRISLSAPEQGARALRRAGFTVFSVANNHTFDRGRLGLVHTLHVLDREHLAYAGAGETPAAAHRPTIIRRHGLRIAFLAYTAWTPESYLSVSGEPALALADPDDLTRDTQAAKKVADLVVVSFHWGVEQARAPSAQQRLLARTAIDAGADLVLGHHPHVRQPVEWYKGRPIFFSLGNFVFDQRGTQASSGWLAVLRLSKKGVRIERLGQIEITACQPRVTVWQRRSWLQAGPSTSLHRDHPSTPAIQMTAASSTRPTVAGLGGGSAGRKTSGPPVEEGSMAATGGRGAWRKVMAIPNAPTRYPDTPISRGTSPRRRS